MKVLVTGAAGFIGFHLVEKLVQMGHDVVGYDNINDYYDVNLKYGRLEQCGIERSLISDFEIVQSSQYPAYRFVKANLEDKSFLLALFAREKFDVAVNLAAQAGVRYSLTNPDAYIKSNIEGFLNLLEAARHHPVKHFVYASSSSVYGSNTKMPFSVQDSVDHPVSLYAASKKSNELMAHTYSHLFGIPTTGLRFFTVYGPWGRPDMALFIFTKAIYGGKPIPVFNNGNMKRDFTYIDDIVEGVVRVIQNPPSDSKSGTGCDTNSRPPYRIYNIGNSSPVKLMDFIDALERAIGIEVKRDLLPMQPGDVSATWADVADLEKDLGYNPHTDISEGVKEFVNWFRSFYALEIKENNL